MKTFTLIVDKVDKEDESFTYENCEDIEDANAWLWAHIVHSRFEGIVRDTPSNRFAVEMLLKAHGVDEVIWKEL